MISGNPSLSWNREGVSPWRIRWSFSGRAGRRYPRDGQGTARTRPAPLERNGDRDPGLGQHSPQTFAPELFLNGVGAPMTRSGFAYILRKHVERAAVTKPSLRDRPITPHVLRHTCAMHTLAATHDIRKVSLWLGHATIQSTEIYLRADPTEKLEALAVMEPPVLRPGRFKAPDKLLSMLNDVRNRRKYAQ